MRLSSRFTLLFGLLALGLSVLLATCWSLLIDRAAGQRAAERLRSEVELVGNLALPLLDSPAELDPMVRSVAKSLQARVTVIDESGRVLADSDIEPSEIGRLENHANRPEIVQARERGTGFAKSSSATRDVDFLYLAERLSRNGRPVGYARLALPLDRLRAEESAAVWLGRGAILVSGLLLFLAGASASRRFSAPLRRVTEAALAVARGDLSRDPPDEDEPEAAALSDAVRRMKNSLLSSLSASESEQSLTALVFDHLPSGIVVLGGRGEIVQANAAFGRMTGNLSPVGRALVDLVREKEVLASFDAALSGAGGRSCTWKRPEDVTWEIDALSLPPGSRGRAIGIFRDVTAVVRTEAMRRRFVSDVSHELRTPVASIVAAAETLVEGGVEGEEAEELTQLIARQATRMSELIDDLTDLSRIESGSIELQWEAVPLLPLAREVCRDMEAQAAERGVRFELSGPEDASAWGDRRRISQIVGNLVDNAVKYSPDAEAVQIEVSREKGAAALCVRDRGPGVPPSEREKIFQRFYQVDPSRSKAKPGTGLGLAIVKHLALLHHAAVEVAGEPGQGAAFRVVFPTAGSSSSF